MEVILYYPAQDVQDLVEIAVDSLEVEGFGEAAGRVLVLLDEIVEEEKRVSQRWVLFEVFMEVFGFSRDTPVDLRGVHLRNGGSFIVYLYCIVGHCSLDGHNNHLSYLKG